MRKLVSPYFSWGAWRVGICRTSQDSDDCSGMVGLQDMNSCRIDLVLKSKLHIVLALKIGRCSSERQGGARTLIPPRSVRSKHSRLGKVTRTREDVWHTRQIPHGIGHAILTAIVGTEIHHFFGVLDHLCVERGSPAVWHYSPRAAHQISSRSCPGSAPKAHIIKHGQNC